MSGPASIPTKTGAELTLIDSDDLRAGLGHDLGEGTMLVIKMRDPGDLRFAEVFLDPEAKRQLGNELLRDVLGDLRKDLARHGDMGSLNILVRHPGIDWTEEEDER